tara:strand:+ start:75 stop:356 length:282 start_codon:yes stop_codon:yes gene_type:complete
VLLEIDLARLFPMILGLPVGADLLPAHDQLFAISAIVVLLEESGQERDSVRRAFLVGGDDIILTSLKLPVSMTVRELAILRMGSVILEVLRGD